MSEFRLRHLVVLLLVSLPSASQSFVRSSPNGVPVAWAMNCLRMYVSSSGSEDFDFSDLEAAVVESMAPWNSIACTGVELIYDGPIESRSVGFSNEGDNHNIIVFRDQIGEWVYPGDVLGLTTLTFCSAVGGACSFAGQLLDGDIEFNGGEAPFSAAPGAVPDHHDFANTLTHELGHFLGLDHSLVPMSTMFASAPIEEIEKRTLAQDDIDGICSIYSTCQVRQTCGLCDPSQADVEGSIEEENLSAGCGCSSTRDRPLQTFGILILLCVVRAVHSQCKSV